MFPQVFLKDRICASLQKKLRIQGQTEFQSQLHHLQICQTGKAFNPKTLESPLDCKEIQPVHSEGDQPWDFFGRNDAKAETPVLWLPHGKSWFIGKDSDAGRGWGQEEKGMTEDEMAGWHHWLDGRESEWTPGVGDGQGGLVCCGSWGRKESDTTQRLIWSDLILMDMTHLSFFPWRNNSKHWSCTYSVSILVLSILHLSNIFFNHYSNSVKKVLINICTLQMWEQKKKEVDIFSKLHTEYAGTAWKPRSQSDSRAHQLNHGTNLAP